MNILNGAKVGVLGAFLLVILSLPALTATQLVTVLGTTSSHAQLSISLTGDANTFLKQTGATYTVSFLKGGQHEALRVTNPTNTAHMLQLQLGTLSSPAVNSLSVNLIAGSTTLLLFQRSAVPARSSYILTIPGGQTVDLNLNVLGNEPSIYGTFNLTVTEI